jgi:hypothetical protein
MPEEWTLWTLMLSSLLVADIDLRDEMLVVIEIILAVNFYKLK